MQTDFTISQDGRIDGVTRTRSTKKFSGFTGGVEVVLTDNNGNILYVTQLQKYGVDGTWIATSDRTERWNEIIPQNVLMKIAKYLIIHKHTPKFNWLSSFKNLVEAAQAIKEIIKKLKN